MQNFNAVNEPLIMTISQSRMGRKKKKNIYIYILKKKQSMNKKTQPIITIFAPEFCRKLYYIKCYIVDNPGILSIAHIPNSTDAEILIPLLILCM
jgi:hypothetical protein